MVKLGYKQTEIGVIPEDWYVKDFGQVGSFFKGKGISMSDVKPMGFPCIMYGDIYVKFDTSFSKCDYHIDIKTAVNSTRANKNDLFFTASGETAEDIGRCVSYQGDEDIYIGGDIIALRPNSSYDSLFLSYVQNSFSLKQQKASFAQGNSVVHISMDNIKKTNFACPSTKKEQESIATALSGLDSLIDNLEKLIAKKKAIKQAAMQELLTGKRRLPGFTGEWESYSIDDIAELCTDTIPIESFDIRYYIGTENMISNKGGISDNRIDIPYTVVRKYQTNDILLSNIRPYLKKIWFADKNGGCSNDVFVIRIKDKQTVVSAFLYYCLCQDGFFDEMMANAIGTKMPRGDKSVIMGFHIRVPREVNEQAAIVDVLNDINLCIERFEERLAKARQIKQGMIQQLLTGKIRLV